MDSTDQADRNSTSSSYDIDMEAVRTFQREYRNSFENRYTLGCLSMFLWFGSSIPLLCIVLPIAMRDDFNPEFNPLSITLALAWEFFGATMLYFANQYRERLLPGIRASSNWHLALIGNDDAGIINGNQRYRLIWGELRSYMGKIAITIGMAYFTLMNIAKQEEDGSRQKGDDTSFTDVVIMFSFALPSIPFYYIVRFVDRMCCSYCKRLETYESVDVKVDADIELS